MLCSLVLTESCPGFVGKYPIQNFTPTDYKAGIQNIDFAQNGAMGLFVANNLGVLAYNGNEWQVYAYQTGKKQRSLAFDERTARLYVGSQGDFGFFRDDWTYVSLLDRVPVSARGFDEVWDVFLINANVYFCTFQGIYVYDGERISVIRHSDGLDRSFSVGGRLFTQSQTGQLYEVAEDSLVAVWPEKTAQRIIAGLIRHENGYLIFYNSGDVEFSTLYNDVEAHENLSRALVGKYVNHVLQLSDTRLAIATQTSGVFLYDLRNHEIENISTQEGLLTNACLRTFQDYTGALWVGMQNGLAQIDIHSPIRLIGSEANIQGSGYDAFETDNGTYYTTSNGIYFLARNAARSVFLAGTEGPAYSIQQIAGRLYAGHHTGLFLLEGARAERLASTNGLWEIKQLRSKPDYAIAGTYAGLFLFRIDANMELRPVGRLAGFTESSRFFEEDRNGRIWVGQFYKGLYCLSPSADFSRVAVQNISEQYDLPINERLFLSRIDDEIYVVTNAGLYRLDQTTDRIVADERFSEVIGDRPVYLFAQDYRKNVYVFAENLVGYFKQLSSDNYVFVPSSLFTFRYAFNNDLLNLSVKTERGVLFNANRGFIHYDYSAEERTPLRSPLLVDRVFSITQDSILYQRQPFATRQPNQVKLLADAQAKVLQFRVVSFRFQDGENQQFRYRLAGFDPDYGEWMDATTKEYTNLPEGDYMFWVQTRNQLGQIVTSEPLALRVKPPFYRSLGAYVFYGGLCLFIPFLLMRWQKSRYNRRAEKIEESKQVALANKQHELLAIEREKRRELLQLQEEKMQSELQHLNKLLAASTMNLVVKNDFIETIKEELTEVKRKGKNQETKRALEKLVKEIDTTLRLQEDWEQFELHFDQVHGDFLSRLRTEFRDLTPNEQKLCAFLRLNLNTKDIANVLGISLRGVEVARYRLRKKLGLKRGQNLSKYILEY